MIEKLVTFDTAKLAFEKGFDRNCPYCYSDKDTIDSSYDVTGEETFSKAEMFSAKENGYTTYLAPSQTLLQWWLRKIHNLNVIVMPYDNEPIDYKPYIFTHLPDNKLSRLILNPYPTYEEAMEEGLKYALTLIKHE